MPQVILFVHPVKPHSEVTSVIKIIMLVWLATGGKIESLCVLIKCLVKEEKLREEGKGREAEKEKERERERERENQSC